MNRSFAEKLTCPHCHVQGALSSANASKICKSFVLRRRTCGSCGNEVFTRGTEEVLIPAYLAGKLIRLEQEMEPVAQEA